MGQSSENKESHSNTDHYHVTKTATNLGNAYKNLKNDPKKKKELLELALAIEEKQYGTEHCQLTKTLENLGIA